MISDFQKFHGLSLQDEIDMINQIHDYLGKDYKMKYQEKIYHYNEKLKLIQNKTKYALI